MPLTVIKSPGKQGTAAVYYKCEDCGDVSHSQASLDLHRSVCHISIQPADEKNEEEISRTDQIAESCECPKCGEHLLLLRSQSFNCTLCEFTDEDQSQFFAHLKQHYEPVVNVQPESLIIEQVMDDESDPGDRDDPEYVPSDGDEDDDEIIDDVPKTSPPKQTGVVEKWKEPSAKSKVGISWESPTNKNGVSSQKKMSFTKPNEQKGEKPKLGIQWKSKEDGQRKMSFVSVPPKPKVTSASPVHNIKEEPEYSASPVKSRPSPGGAMSKWVRLEDICHSGMPSRMPSSNYISNLKYTPRRTLSPTKARSADDGSKSSKKGEKKRKEKPPKAPREVKIPICGICKRIFTSNQGLKMHMRIHTGDKRYTCEFCGKAFTQQSTCKQHIESQHSDTKKYTCEYCGSSFARSTSLTIHRRIHTGEVLHNCDACGKGFRAKSYLIAHRRLHTGEKPYKCEFCFKTFRVNSDMKRHRNSVHFGLGNVGLTQAREMLLFKMEGIRTPSRPTTNVVIERYVNEDSASSDDSAEIIRATTVIAGSHYEL